MSGRKLSNTGIKIAFVNTSNFFKVQGSTEAYYLYNHLNHHHNVKVIIPIDERGQSNPTRRNSIYYICRPRYIYDFLWFNVVALLRLVRLGPRNVDLIYSYKNVFLPPLIFKFLFGKKWICDLRAPPVEQEYEFAKLSGRLNFRKSLYYKVKEYSYKFSLRYCDMIVTLSEGIKEILVSKYGIPPSKIYIQPLGVDLAKFKPEKSRLEEWSLRNKQLELTCVTSAAGWWRAQEIATVLKAIRLLCKRSIGAKLTLIGAIPNDVVDKLKNVAQKNNIASRFEWKGFIPHDKVSILLQNCDIALSPLPELESYKVASPAKVFEYLAMERIVIASDIECNRRIIEDGKNGLLYEPGNAEDLANKIEKVYKDDELVYKLKKNSRQSVEIYEWHNMLKDLENEMIYKVKEKE